MRVLLLCNNWVGWQVTRWLRDQGEDIAGLVVHPAGQRKYGDEIVGSVGLPPDRVFEAGGLRTRDTREAIRALGAEVAVSAFFGHILRPRFLDLFPQGVVNLHPSLLPYNRGAYPNVWSLVDGTPSGVTLHYVDAGVDTGDIIRQRVVPATLTDTGGSLYRKLEQACVELFQEAWPLLREGQVAGVPQDPSSGTVHRAADTAGIDEIDLDRSYPARDLLNVLRARTFPPHPGAFFRENGKKIYARVELEEEAGASDDH